MAPPSKFAHVVYNTHRYEEMIAWYLDVFEAKLQKKTDALAFITYDEEHHRMAFVNLGPADGDVPSKPDGVGVHHVAYTWDTLPNLMDVYKRLKAKGILPFFSVRHGPTLSMYYNDPDGNGMEFQIDLLSVDEANAFMESDAFGANPIGEKFDPDEIVDMLDAGKSVEAIVLRSDQGAPKEGLHLGVG